MKGLLGQRVSDGGAHVVNLVMAPRDPMRRDPTGTISALAVCSLAPLAGRLKEVCPLSLGCVTAGGGWCGPLPPLAAALEVRVGCFDFLFLPCAGIQGNLVL